MIGKWYIAVGQLLDIVNTLNDPHRRPKGIEQALMVG